MIEAAAPASPLDALDTLIAARRGNTTPWNCSSTAERNRGNICVIDTAVGFSGGIFTGQRWAIQGPSSLHFLGAETVNVMGAWHV